MWLIVGNVIGQLASTMVSVAMTRAIEIVSRSISDITMVTLEALDLDGYVSHCYGNNKGNYPTQLPWLRGKVFDVTETFRGIYMNFLFGIVIY